MIRRLLVLLVLIGCHFPVHAQQETLLDGEVTHGGFGALGSKFSAIGGSLAYLQGVRGGWIINFREAHSVSLGLGTYDLENEISFYPPFSEGNQHVLALDYTGFELEYTYGSRQLLHVSVPMLIGGGSAGYHDADSRDDSEVTDGVFVLEPGVNAEVNIVNWFRVAGGLSYRWVSGLTVPALSDGDVSNLSAVITLKFGDFM